MKGVTRVVGIFNISNLQYFNEKYEKGGFLTSKTRLCLVSHQRRCWGRLGSPLNETESLCGTLLVFQARFWLGDSLPSRGALK